MWHLSCVLMDGTSKEGGMEYVYHVHMAHPQSALEAQTDPNAYAIQDGSITIRKKHASLAQLTLLVDFCNPQTLIARHVPRMKQRMAESMQPNVLAG